MFRYVLRTYAAFFLGIFVAVLVIFLVADFVDRSKAYTGPNWVADVLELYFHKAMLAILQLGPAALLLGAGMAISGLRKRGELTALQALTFGPGALYLPVLAIATVVALGLVAFDETVVTQSGRRVDEITLQRFHRWGDLRFYLFPKQWFRRGDRIFQLRSGDADRGFENVTILRLDERFRLLERYDAGQMVSIGGTRWALRNVTERDFSPEGEITVTTYDEREYDFGVGVGAFRIRTGRPEQMRFVELREQIRARRGSGLPSLQFALALHNRFAYPLAGIPAALLAVGLALRPGRKGHLTAAVVEGLLVSMTLWGLMVVARTLVLSGRLPAGVAAWAPTTVLVIASTVLWLRNNGRLRWKPA